MHNYVKIVGFSTPAAIRETIENQAKLLGKIFPLTGNAYYGLEIILPDGSRRDLFHYYYKSVYKNGKPKE